VHNPDRPPHRLEDSEIRAPKRDARVLTGYTLLGRQVDVVETSGGCTLRLQLLFDHRNEGAQFSHLFFRPRAGGH
jgi:hypothetical protein